MGASQSSFGTKSNEQKRLKIYTRNTMTVNKILDPAQKQMAIQKMLARHEKTLRQLTLTNVKMRTSNQRKILKLKADKNKLKTQIQKLETAPEIRKRVIDTLNTHVESLRKKQSNIRF